MTDTRARRVAVLTAAAKAKSQAKTRAADQAIRALIKRGEPITFQAVHREAGVSHAFLYTHPELRPRIEHLRTQARPAPVQPTSPDPESAVVLALTAQITQRKSNTAKKFRPCVTPLNKPTARTSTSDANAPAAAGLHQPHHPRQPADSSVDRN